MDTAGGSDGPRRPAGTPRLALMAIVAVSVVAFGLLTTVVPDRDVLEPETIDPTALVEPEIEAGFRVVAELPTGPWQSHRINDAYLYVDDAPWIVTDDDRVVDIDLPEMGVLFGAIATRDESVAFGRTSTGPAIWRSTDNLSWELERLPWDGTVRAAAEIDGHLVVIGISRNGPAFTYVAATEVPRGWLTVETTEIPDSGLISVPAGFVGRGNATDGSGYGYLYSDDGADWAWQADRAAAGSRSPGQLPAFVIEADETLLRLPGDERAFAPPAWPISGVWLEGETMWLQTPSAAWASVDGEEWLEYPINAETGVDGGYSVLLPVGETARVATSSDDRVYLMRWDPGSG